MGLNIFYIFKSVITFFDIRRRIYIYDKKDKYYAVLNDSLHSFKSYLRHFN